MKAKKHIMTGLVISAGLLLVITSFGVAQYTDRGGPQGRGPDDRPGRGGPPMGLDRLMRQLDLTEEQTQQIEAIEQTARQEGESSREKMHQARQALDQAVTSGASEDQIRTAASELGKTIGDEAVARSATMTSVKKILTAEQSAKLDQLLSERPERQEQMRGGPQGPGQERQGNYRQQRFQGQERPEGQERFQGQGGAGNSQDSRRQRGPSVDRLFERFDSNGDGMLSREELEAMSQQRQDRPARPW